MNIITLYRTSIIEKYRLIIIFLFVIVPKISLAKINIEVKISPITNLIRQLDCVSECCGHCRPIENYQQLWSNTFIHSATDHGMIKKWKEVMEQYKNVNLLGLTNMAQKLNIASFQAKKSSDYFERLDLLITPEDQEIIKTIINHFYPTFMKWWNEDAKTHGKNFSNKFTKALRCQKMSDQIKQFTTFYQTDFKEANFRINLFYIPRLINSNNQGELIERYVTIGFYSYQTPNDIIDIPLHEFSHWLFRQNSQDQLTQLENKFLSMNSLTAKAAYNLLDEVLATALNQGIITRANKPKKQWVEYLSHEQSFYNDEYIDKAAKAIIPLLDLWLANKKTIYSNDFVKEYVTTLEKSFNDGELLAPQAQLRKMVLYTNNQINKNLYNEVMKAFTTDLFYHTSEYNDHKYANLNGLLIVDPQDLNQTKLLNLLPQDQIDIIKAEFEKKDQVIYSYQKDLSSILYVLVAKDYNSILALLNKLATLKEGLKGGTLIYDEN